MTGAEEGPRRQDELGLRSSRRDPEKLREQLEGWLQRVRPGAVLRGVEIPERTGISSLSLVLDVAGAGAGGAEAAGPERLVARIAPEPAAVPVFPIYDLALQFDVLELMAARSRAPVPRPLWYEPDTTVVGTEFVVMEHVEGLVPPDVMPYTFGSWLSEAPAADQRRLQEAAVDALAAVHDTPLPDALAARLDPPGAGGRSPLERHVQRLRDYYAWCCADGPRVPVLEAGLEWLQANLPAAAGKAVLSWGDARIGNMIFRDLAPVALLDWEMAAVAPREVDLGWMVYLHRWFDDIAASFGLAPMSTFMRVEDVAGRYEAASGVAVAPLRWYLFYAALRHGVIMFRVARRQIAHGEAAMADDPDELVLHHRTLRRMIDGSYWPGFDC